MTLEQFDDLKRWHQRHIARHPFEKHVWDLVLTFWLAGCVGLPAALLIHAAWALPVCAGLLYLPGAYVGLRRRLHRRGALRCDWIGALH